MTLPHLGLASEVKHANIALVLWDLSHTTPHLALASLPGLYWGGTQARFACLSPEKAGHLLLQELPPLTPAY